jgi:hypothetical protein
MHFPPTKVNRGLHIVQKLSPLCSQNLQLSPQIISGYWKQLRPSVALPSKPTGNFSDNVIFKVWPL